MNTSKVTSPLAFATRTFFLVAGSMALLWGCCSVQTRVARTKKDGSIKGITYCLPRSYLKVSIESKKDKDGNHEELFMCAKPEIFPDKNARLVINEENNEWFTRDHAFSFTDGMLSSVKISDEGKAGEVVGDLAAIALNIVSMGALPVPLAWVPKGVYKGPKEPKEPREPKAPSSEEILAALSSITAGEHSFILDHKESSTNTALPGTRGLVTFTAITKDIDTNITANAGAADLKSFDGVAVKLLEPYPVNVALQIDMSVLITQRVNSARITLKDLEQQQNNNNKAITEIEKQIKETPASSTNELIKLNKERDKLLDDSSAIAKGITNATEILLENEPFLKEGGPKYTRYFSIAAQSYMVMLPDFSPIVKIALPSAPLGKTSYALTLNKGVLTDFHAQNPSLVAEVVKVPLNISKSLVSLPQEIIQLKIDYSSKAKELAEKEAEYIQAENALKKARQASTQDSQNLDRQQKDILTLEKEVSTLKAAIKEIESK